MKGAFEAVSRRPCPFGVNHAVCSHDAVDKASSPWCQFSKAHVTIDTVNRPEHSNTLSSSVFSKVTVLTDEGQRSGLRVCVPSIRPRWEENRAARRHKGLFKYSSSHDFSICRGGGGVAVHAELSGRLCPKFTWLHNSFFPTMKVPPSLLL